MILETCSICLDEEEEIHFRCLTADCEYSLCHGCLRQAFQDASGANTRNCPMCSVPTAKEMLLANIGPGGLRAVEDEIRPKIEHEVRSELEDRKQRKQDASVLNEQARILFNEIAEKVNMKCPKCHRHFDDYTGCNALTCVYPNCNAKFCAICLEDCGTDAHAHVRTHGNLYDRELYHRSKKERVKQIVSLRLEEIKTEHSFELMQLVANKLHMSEMLEDPEAIDALDAARSLRFVERARKDLQRIIAADRSSVLLDDSNRRQGEGLRTYHLSPRHKVPEHISIRLERNYERGYNDKVVFEIVINVQVGTNQLGVNSEELKEMMITGKIPMDSTVLNVQQSLLCAVVAFEGHANLVQTSGGQRLGKDKVSISLSDLNRDGTILRATNCPDWYFFKVIALNGNDRLLRLDQHAKTVTTLPLAVQHLVGSGKTRPVLKDLNETLSPSFRMLNKEQQEAAHPLALKTAREIAGPSGTGKTMVIGSLVKELLTCSNKNIVVLSERNGAIDAIADKFSKMCFENHGKRKVVRDLETWKHILSFGSKEGVGSHTAEFLLDNKTSAHPDVIDAAEAKRRHEAVSDTRAKQMREIVATNINVFADRFNDDTARRAGDRIVNENSLSTPLTCISTVKATLEAMEELQSSGVSEGSVREAIKKTPDLIERLFAIPREENAKFGREANWNREEVTLRLVHLLQSFRQILKNDAFDENIANEIHARLRQAQKQLGKVIMRVKRELGLAARLRMATIGSSHRLFDNVMDEDTEDCSNEEYSLAADMIDLSINSAAGTVVLFDEAGCIPAFELLGLSRLDCSIDSIIVVGDKKQLAPYDPSSGQKSRKAQPILSILDVSQIPEHRLTTQYRVPLDIAEILNASIYFGNYNSDGRVPERGLWFFHVETPRVSDKKYVNEAEVAKVVSLLRNYAKSGDPSVVNLMVLTPYKKQQREIKFQVKKSPYLSWVKEDRIMTVDQCQGQEADLVILSLVQRPTRFLDCNRLNVALSRTSERLYIVGDRGEFAKASRNTNWDCHQMAQDILLNPVQG